MYKSCLSTSSCFKSPTSLKFCSSDTKHNSLAVPVVDERQKSIRNGSANSLSSSFLNKITSSCLKSPDKIDFARPLNMSSTCLFFSSPTVLPNIEKTRPKSCKTSTISLHDDNVFPQYTLELCNIQKESNNYIVNNNCLKYTNTNYGYSLDKSKLKLKQEFLKQTTTVHHNNFKIFSSTTRTNNIFLTSPKSESNLSTIFTNNLPRRSLPPDHCNKNSNPSKTNQQKSSTHSQNIDKNTSKSSKISPLCNVLKINSNNYDKPIEHSKLSPSILPPTLQPISCECVASLLHSNYMNYDFKRENIVSNSFNIKSDEPCEQISPGHCTLAKNNYLSSHKITLVDCRTFVLYNNNHIISALNVSCSDCITRKRLLCGKIHIGDLVSGPEDAKITFRCSLDDENVKIVLYDEDSTDEAALPKTHPLKVISTNLVQFNRTVYFLEGGMKEFSKKYKELCVESSRSVQLESISFSPTTPLPEENIDGASISQILPFLYIGNERDSLNAQLLADCHVTHVINVTSHLPMPLPNIHYKRIPASDSSCQNLKQYFDEAINFIDEARSADGKVMIHCQAGVSRSATLAMAYIMTRYRVSMMKAFKIVKKNRPIIAPNFNFLGQLLELESRLGLSNESSFESHNINFDVSDKNVCGLENDVSSLLISNKNDEDVSVSDLNKKDGKGAGQILSMPS